MNRETVAAKRARPPMMSKPPATPWSTGCGRKSRRDLRRKSKRSRKGTTITTVNGRTKDKSCLITDLPVIRKAYE
jgi:hypothetical protein